ncbi:MAG: hypothetical protein OHK93_003331 [Ramalina farinacea]|uniref:Uncharacterized protein n=1 Tax=Ramalina farinacea TaxID=258253 RepID=A0AA43TY40_9LECA|nr:hypothetical protein [Ramalina farinacea]
MTSRLLAPDVVSAMLEKVMATLEKDNEQDPGSDPAILLPKEGERRELQNFLKLARSELIESHRVLVSQQSEVRVTKYSERRLLTLEKLRQLREETKASRPVECAEPKSTIKLLQERVRFLQERVRLLQEQINASEAQKDIVDHEKQELQERVRYAEIEAKVDKEVQGRRRDILTADLHAFMNMNAELQEKLRAAELEVKLSKSQEDVK